METILVTGIVGVCVLLASSMIYTLVWNLFRVYFTKYMDTYFEYNKDTYEYGGKTLLTMVERLAGTLETIYKLENNIPVNEETEKNED